MKCYRLSVLFFTFLLSSVVLLAQSKQEEEYIMALPAFTMYGDNYFIGGTSLNDNPFSPRTSDVKFEIGFKQRLTNVALPFGLYPFIAYRQKSFWDVLRDSFPFRETNYNPSIGLVKLFADEKGITDAIWFAFEHESNGRDKEASRSWNFFSLTYLKSLGWHWVFRSKLWLPIGEMIGNEDIPSYRGYGSLGASYHPNKNIFIDLDIQPAYKDRLTGFVKCGISFRVLKDRNQFLYLQYFGGYAEDLINYNHFSSKLRIGIILKDFALFGSRKK